jgi:hypothetical protein
MSSSDDWADELELVKLGSSSSEWLDGLENGVLLSIESL